MASVVAEGSSCLYLCYHSRDSYNVSGGRQRGDRGCDYIRKERYF